MLLYNPPYYFGRELIMKFYLYSILLPIVIVCMSWAIGHYIMLNNDYTIYIENQKEYNIICNGLIVNGKRNPLIDEIRTLLKSEDASPIKGKTIEGYTSLHDLTIFSKEPAKYTSDEIEGIKNFFPSIVIDRQFDGKLRLDFNTDDYLIVKRWLVGIPLSNKSLIAPNWYSLYPENNIISTVILLQILLLVISGIKKLRKWNVNRINLRVKSREPQNCYLRPVLGRIIKKKL